MNSAVIAFLASLLVLCAQDTVNRQQDPSSKCKCYKEFTGRISSKLIKGEPVIHSPSNFCPHTEIIITTTADMKKCVNPKSPLRQLILKNKEKQEKNGAGSMTKMTTATASSQTHTTRLHQTSKL
ncbi:uncharacterized protein LOC144464361 [Epinephelus lanceolatus]